MITVETSLVSIAVRVYPESAKDSDHHLSNAKRPRRPSGLLVFDTETTTDPTQRLTFGSYRFIEDGECKEEALFYGNDLPDKERRVLEEYVSNYNRTANGTGSRLLLLSRHAFVAKLFKLAYKSRAFLIALNFPFDVSRIALQFGAARGRFSGGFSFDLWSYEDDEGREHSNKNRPRIAIKKIDSKRALKGFTARKDPDPGDLIPLDGPTGDPQKTFIFRGHFLDLRTLAFALTNDSYGLETACQAFNVEHGKQHIGRHGIVTPEYIDYNRRDVLATSELALKLFDEYDKHPIELQETKSYSPASIGKAYLRAMGIKPILQRQMDFPKKYLGFAQSAFFGGRTSVHIRKAIVPVVYTDFLSMYTTVNSLTGLWRYVIAREIKIVEHCREEIQAFLSHVTTDELFKPKTWASLTAFVKIIPDGDILPSRGKYSPETNDWQVGVNYLHATEAHPDNRALWFSLPDVVASVLLTGRIPTIVDAFRIEPKGILPGLKSVRLRGEIEVDPGKRDFFRTVIEERKRLSSRSNIPDSEKSRLDKFLKVLASAASYGIYAEMNRQEDDERVSVNCHGIDADPFKCTVQHADTHGEYCFPPLASLITGAAHLMLALLERCVTDLGGTYAMEDTDSMAIVATKSGGFVQCPGGPLLNDDGQEGVNALSWKQVEEIRDRFTSLNPYSRDAISGSVLKIEDLNFDRETGDQRQLYCLAISAKRYALFIKDEKNIPVLVDHSEHGLGHLLNPTDPESEDRNWIGQVWLNMIRRALGLRTEKLAFENSPAIGRITISSPMVMKALSKFNSGKPYGDQIKPFNFLLTCQISPLGHPAGTDPKRFHLIAPYETNPNKWVSSEWVDQYTGKSYRITGDGHYGDRFTARVKTYGDVVCEYELHPESKCADAEGNVCGKQTVGLLQRRRIQIDGITYIGKESNRLEDVEAGTVHSADDVYTEYPDARRDEWATKILPLLKKIRLAELVKLSGLSRRALSDIRAGRSRPHPKNEQILQAVVYERLRLDAIAANERH
jgi:hypothetical protein